MEPERMIRAIIKAIAILFEWILIGMFVGVVILLACTSLKGQCPNNWCEGAVEIGCEPTSFDNFDCDPNFECILQHPVATSVCCGGTAQYSTQWFTFTTYTYGIWEMNLESNYATGTGAIGNYGPLEGITWSLATGSCDTVEWIASYQCHTFSTNCFCGPPGPNAWAGPCDQAPCSDPQYLTDFWHQDALYPIGNWTPYDPTQQSWHMVFPLPPGTYYLMIGGFATYGPTPSLGEGTITLCHSQPLNTPPILEVEGTELQWTGETTGVFYIEQLEILTSEWNQIGETTEHRWPLTSGGYYRVLNEYGTSNPVHVPPIVKASGGVIYNVLGQENAKFGIQSKP